MPAIWILKNRGGNFYHVYQQGDPGRGIGGYDLESRADRAFALDYDHNGKLDDRALYRPGTGTIWILKNRDGVFHPVYQQGDPENGIGGYVLKSSADQAFSFDYDHSRKLNHLIVIDQEPARSGFEDAQLVYCCPTHTLKSKVHFTLLCCSLSSISAFLLLN